MRSAFIVVMIVLAASRLAAQETPPPIPRFAVDLHATVPMFPTSSDELLLSRGLPDNLAQLPGTGLGLQVGLHVYPVHWRVITLGFGGEVAASRASQSPPPGGQGLQSIEEKFLTAAPQLSFNFGTGHGWSYLSGGIGFSQWSLIADGQPPTAPDTERLKTINYGGGARWFARPHLAFSFDVRFYAVNPSTPAGELPPSPRTTLLVLGAGVSLK
jgi:hypothetical protein